MALKNGEKLIGRYFIVNEEADHTLSLLCDMWGKTKIDTMRYILDETFKLSPHMTTDEIRKGKLIMINKQHKTKLIEITSRMVINVGKQVLNIERKRK